MRARDGAPTSGSATRSRSPPPGPGPSTRSRCSPIRGVEQPARGDPGVLRSADGAEGLRSRGRVRRHLRDGRRRRHADQLATRIAAALPKGLEAITAASAAAQQQDQVTTAFGFLRTSFFLIFGFVALFVGAFIVFNTFNIVVSQRAGSSRCSARWGRAVGSCSAPCWSSPSWSGSSPRSSASRSAPPRARAEAFLSSIEPQLPPTALVLEPRTVIVS